MNLRETQKKIMLKQVSALNTFWIVEYLKENHPGISVHDIIKELNQNKSYFVKNLKTHTLERVSINHLINPAYWFSNEFMIHLYEVVQTKIPDPDLAYKIGKTCYKSQHILKTAIGIPLIGPYRLLKIMTKENRKYNRTKENTIVKLEKGHVVLRVTHKKNIIINNFAMDWHTGIFESYARLAGAKNVIIRVNCIEKGPVKYGDPGRATWEFDIRFTYHSPFIRLFNSFLFNIPAVRDIIEDANKIQEEHNEQILNRDMIIKEKTDALKSIQNRMLEEERKNIEKKLQNISAELVSTEERERRLIAEDLHDSVSQSLAITLSKIKDLNHSQCPGGGHELKTVQRSLEQAISELRSLTFQISPPILYNMGLEKALKWLVKEINKSHEMEIVFNNMITEPVVLNDTLKIVLYRSVRELIINIIKHAKTKYAEITLSLFDNQFTISVEDNGIGFDTEILNKTDALGFGLFSILERIKTLGGEIEIYSETGKGTNIIIFSPMQEKGV